MVSAGAEELGGRDVTRHVLGGWACKAPFASFSNDVHRKRYLGLGAWPVTIITPHIPVPSSTLWAAGCLSAQADDLLPYRAVAEGGW